MLSRLAWEVYSFSSRSRSNSNLFSTSKIYFKNLGENKVFLNLTIPKIFVKWQKSLRIFVILSERRESKDPVGITSILQDSDSLINAKKGR